MTDSNAPQYDASSIQHISFMDALRMRPEMYVGGRDAIGLHNYLFAVLDFMIDEALDNRCHHIWVTLRPNNEVIFRNDSVEPVLKVTRYPREDKSILEMRLQYLSSRAVPCDSYRVRGGVHGVGIQVATALSAEMTVETAQEGYLWRKTYAKGQSTSDLQKIRPASEDEHGVTFILKPDYTIFDLNPVSYEVLAQRCQEVAYQVRGLCFTLRDETCDPPREEIFCPSDGLKTWVTDLNADQPVLHEPIHIADTVEIRYRDDCSYTIEVEFTCQFTDSTESHILSCSNTVPTAGGVHLKAMQEALLERFNAMLCPSNLLSNPPLFTWDEITIGLSAIVAVKSPNPQYLNHDHVELMNPEIYESAKVVLSKALHMTPDEGLRQVFDHLLKGRTSISPNPIV